MNALKQSGAAVSAAPLDLFGSQEALRSILQPRSVVVIGASTQEATMAGAPLRNLLRHGYSGRIYAINPNRAEVAGVKANSSLKDLPETPDTAVLVVAADLVPQALRDCAALGIKSATVVASGFGEGAAGEAGYAREAELATVLRETGIRIVGPNTAGLMNVADNYVPRAALNHPEKLRVGDVAIVTQSGALCNTLTNRALLHGLGLTYVAATGEQLDLDLWDFAAFALEDPRTRTILMIIEGFKSPEKFLKVAHRARELGKPIIALKIGVSDLGSSVVATHSGALAGVSAVQAAVLKEWNVVSVHEIDELWEVGHLMQLWGVPGGPASKIGLVSMSGGEAALAADEAAGLGLDFPQLSQPILDRLQALSPLAKAANPFDTAGGVMSRPELVGDAARIMLDEPGLDAVVVASPVFVGMYADRMYTSIIKAAKEVGHPRVAVSAWTAGELTKSGQAILRSGELPIFKGAHRALRAIGCYDQYGLDSRRPLPAHPIAKIGRDSKVGTSTVLTYWESRDVLAAAGVPFNKAEMVQTEEEAIEAAVRIGLPVSMKLSKSDIIHKADKGAVFVMLSSEAAVRDAARHLAELGQMEAGLAPGEGIVVEQFVGSVAAVLIGGSRDPEFGPVLVFGLGGGYAEAYADVDRATCPFDQDRSKRLIGATRIGKVLERQPKARKLLEGMLPRLGSWYASSREVYAFDVNPLLVSSDGTVCAVDARIELAPSTSS